MLSFHERKPMKPNIQISEIEVNAPLDRRYTLALITDTHAQFPQTLYTALGRRRLDGITIAGDLVDRPADLQQGETWEFLSWCASRAPTFLALGNHERCVTAKQLQAAVRSGVTVLNNGSARLGELLVGGLTSGYCGPKRRAGGVPNLVWLEEFSKESGFKILLCHHPEYYPRYIRQTPIQLTLSGHAHGGQIRVAGRGLYAPGQGILPKYTSGLYENRLIVSRGLSNTAGVIPRLGNSRQLVLIHLGQGG